MHWNKDDIACLNCGEKEMCPVLERDDGETVLWCKLCGAILSSNQYDPIETDNFSIPKMSSLRTDLPFSQFPSFHPCKKKINEKETS